MSDDPFVQLSMSDRVVRPCLLSGGPHEGRIGRRGERCVTAPGRGGSRGASPRPLGRWTASCAPTCVRRAVANPEPTRLTALIAVRTRGSWVTPRGVRRVQGIHHQAGRLASRGRPVDDAGSVSNALFGMTPSLMLPPTGTGTGGGGVAGAVFRYSFRGSTESPIPYAPMIPRTRPRNSSISAGSTLIVVCPLWIRFPPGSLPSGRSRSATLPVAQASVPCESCFPSPPE